MTSLLERYERQAVILGETRELPLVVRENLARAGIARFLGLPQPVNFDAHANFAYSTVATAPSPATSGTSLVVASGGGALFPTPPFNATVWPASQQPLAANAEIVRVTAISTDTLTIVRAQESSSARSIGVGDQIAATITKKTITDVEAGGVGRSSLVYRYTVAGSVKASIDTGSDTPDAGSNDWTNGDALEIWMMVQTDNAAAIDTLSVTVNNDTGANYDQQRVQAERTNLSGALTLAASAWTFDVHGSAGAGSYVGTVRMSFPAYAKTTFNKVGEAANEVLDTGGGNVEVRALALGWRSTAAITRIKIAPATGGKNLQIGSQILIYKRLAS